MAIVTVESVEKLIPMNKLSGLDVEFISIVPQGAVATPFQIIKTDLEYGDNMAGQVIQSFILPNTAEFDALKRQPGNEWMSALELDKCEKAEFPTVTRYTVIHKSEFDEKSLGAIPVGDGWAVTGQLKGDAVSKIQKASIPMITVPADYQTSAGDVIQSQLWNFTDIMWASLYQAAADPKKRKTTIMNALSNFWDFLNAILDEIPASAMKGDMPKRDTAKRDVMKSAINKADNANTVDNTEPSGGNDMERDDVIAVFKELREAEKAEQDALKVETEKSETIATISKAITELTTVVTSVKADIETMKQSDPVDGASGAASDASVDSKVKDEAIAALKGDIQKLVAKVDSLTHSTSTPSPVGDPEPQVKYEAPVGKFTGAW